MQQAGNRENLVNLLRTNIYGKDRYLAPMPMAGLNRTSLGKSSDRQTGKNMTTHRYHTAYLLSITFISAMGGLLFGYDYVVIGGAKPFYEVFFGITGSPHLQGWAMSSALIGCLLGAGLSGLLSDRYGRKKLLLGAAVLFTVSAVGTGAVDHLNGFIVYRLLGGIGIGIASNLSPMYIAEVSPPDIRGRFVSINQLTIVVGILAAQISNWLIADPVAAQTDILSSWNGQMGWRWMFWAETLPAALFFAGMFMIPESPRWLAARGRNGEAGEVLLRVGGPDYAQEQLDEIGQSLKKQPRSSFRTLFAPELRLVLGLGIVIAVFQQWCGINVIFNYAQEVFAAAGYEVSDILLNIVVTGVTNLIFTFVGMYTVDRLGRRVLMLIGAGGLAVIYLCMGACYYFQVSGWAVLTLVVAAIACYAMTLAPVTWVLLAEIFPNRVRGAAMAMATFFLWGACFVLTYTFPILNHALQASGTFWLYGGICLAGYAFLWRHLSETKGESLEAIEQKWVRRSSNDTSL